MMDAGSAGASLLYDARRGVYYTRPLLRGWLHLLYFWASLPGASLLLARAHDATQLTAAAVYSASLTALFGTSALYHRGTWTAAWRLRLRHLDQAMIFFLIAGTYTPFALLVLHGALANAILVVVWIGAIAGAVVEMIWIDHPKWVGALIYLSLGWVAVAAFPELWTSMGVGGTLLVAAGGLLYTAGAVVYATQRPDPNPAIFGYHEIFHLLVIAAAVAHFSAVAFFALPAA